MRLVIVGPGALGILLAVRLAEPARLAGLELTVIDHRQDRARALDESGLVLETGSGPLTARIPVTTCPQASAPADLVIFCVKSTALDQALKQCIPLLGPDTLSVGIQNGMLHPDLLCQAPGIPMAAVCSDGATLVAPGRARHNGSGLTRLGFLDPNRRREDRLRLLVRLFQDGGLEAEATDTIHPYLWQKLLINAAINPLTGIHDRKNGQLLTSCSVRSTMKKLVAEATAVARANQITFDHDPLTQVFAVCRKTRNNISSMLQDLYRGNPTEIEAINGFLVREGERLNIATPVNREMVQRIRELEQTGERRHSA